MIYKYVLHRAEEMNSALMLKRVIRRLISGRMKFEVEDKLACSCRHTAFACMCCAQSIIYSHNHNAITNAKCNSYSSSTTCPVHSETKQHLNLCSYLHPRMNLELSPGK